MRNDIDAAAVIVGAGPAGIATAISAALRDPKSVSQLLVLDRADFPRHKPCGGGITRRGEVALAELQLSPDLPNMPILTTRITIGSRSHDFCRSRPYFRVYDRTAFDSWLVQQAKELGIAVLQCCRVFDIVRRDDSFEVHTEKGVFRTPLVVGADGAASVVRRLTMPRSGRLCRLLEVFTEFERGSADDIAHFDFTPLLFGVQGYAWTFPTIRAGEKQLNQGIFDSRVHPARRSTSLITELTRFLRRADESESDVRQRIHLNSHPLTPWAASILVGAGGVMLVGDAMGADGLTGEGISVALSHGILAGKALVESRMDPCRSVLSYERLVRASPTTASLRNDRLLSSVIYGRAGATLVASGLTAANWIRN